MRCVQALANLDRARNAKGDITTAELRLRLQVCVCIYICLCVCMYVCVCLCYVVVYARV